MPPSQILSSTFCNHAGTGRLSTDGWIMLPVPVGCRTPEGRKGILCGETLPSGPLAKPSSSPRCESLLKEAHQGQGPQRRSRVGEVGSVLTLLLRLFGSCRSELLRGPGKKPSCGSPVAQEACCSEARGMEGFFRLLRDHRDQTLGLNFAEEV